MKKLLTLFLVLWCSTAWAVEPINLARTNAYVAGAKAACTQTTVGTQDSTITGIGTSAKLCYSYLWTPSTTQTIKRMYFEVFKVGTPTSNYNIVIQTGVSHGAPGTTIANGTSGTVAASTFSASPTLGWSYVTFSTAPTVTASTTYGIALCADVASASNTIVWGKDADGNGTTDNTGYYSTGIGDNWAVLEDHAGPVLWVTSCDEAKP